MVQRQHQTPLAAYPDQHLNVPAAVQPRVRGEAYSRSASLPWSHEGYHTAMRFRGWAERTVGRIEDQERLDGPSYTLEHGFALTMNLLGDRNESVANFLHGTWLGHPLHPVLTDVPLGAWTVALVLDGLDMVGHGTDRFARTARAAVGLGIVGGVGAAAAGLTDWQHSQDRARRTGMVHGALNTAALGLFTSSWVARRRGQHGVGRLSAAAGYALTVASSYLGGSLVYRHRLGVDHSEQPELVGDGLRLREFTAVARLEDLTESNPRRFVADEVPVVLVRRGDVVYAVGERCPHLGAPMAEGWLYRNGLVCPWHGSRFDLAQGDVRRGPATAPLPCFDVQVHDGHVKVRRRSPGVTSDPEPQQEGTDSAR